MTHVVAFKDRVTASTQIDALAQSVTNLYLTWAGGAWYDQFRVIFPWA